MESLTQYGGWSDRVQAVSLVTLNKEINALNNPIAFITTDSQAHMLKRLQERLTFRSYHLLSDTFLEKFLVSFEVFKNVPFHRHINVIIHNLQSGGLLEKWYEDEGIDPEIVRDLLRSKIEPKTSDGSSIPTFVWCGWIASVIVFVCEIIWSKVKLIVEEQTRKLNRNVRKARHFMVQT